jgi:outer membrane receptor for ferrienterochelin and colicin
VVPTGAIDDAGREIVASANAGTLRLVGVETALRARIEERVELSADVSAVRGDQTTGDVTEPADRIPPLGGRLWLRWRATASVAVEAGARWAHAQRRLSERDRAGPPRRQPGFGFL